jgi:SAM-dependent methyltransferase
MGEARSRTNAASTGQAGAAAGFLDAHFEACRPQYEAMLRSVGLRPGWRVLDAACGSGSFLPLLADLVGPGGAIAAFDLAAENVERVQALVSSWSGGCPVEARVASLTALPYADGAFDAAWCANALEYLSDDELALSLAELRRVVRPGGLVAIKDADGGLWLFAPGDPTLLPRAWAAAGRVSAPFRGTLRSREMRRHLERVGLLDVWQRATLVELWAPLQPVQRQYVGQWLAMLGALAEQGGVPDGDRAFWARQRDPDAPGALASAPELFWCEGHILAVGRVPDGAG